MFQSTHPRGVRRLSSPNPHHPQRVSIHAPARGATFARSVAMIWPLVSIHAPARGATGQLPSGIYATDQFQSTHPRGVRPRLGATLPH